MFEVTIAGWVVTLGSIGVLVAFDLWQSRRNPHAIGLREAAAWSLFYAAIAMLFGVVFGLVAGWNLGGQYFAGYVVERSLSIDNLFVFVIVMSTFAVPADQRARVLTLGIVGALVLRAVFIALGAAMLEAFSATYLIFGLALAATGVQLFLHRDKDQSVGDNAVVIAAQRLLPVADRYDQHRLLSIRLSGSQHAYSLRGERAPWRDCAPRPARSAGSLDRPAVVRVQPARCTRPRRSRRCRGLDRRLSSSSSPCSVSRARHIKSRRDPTARAHAGYALRPGSAHQNPSPSPVIQH